MTTTESPPIACTLAPGAYKDRMAWIGALTRDALRSHERRDLVLDLRYAPEARDRVRELVRNEQACCSFLSFDLREEPNEIRLTITAPETARDAADTLFEQFVAGAPSQSACACAAPSSDAVASGEERQPGTKAAGLTAVTLATGAVACGACCVLPLALPAALLAGTGGVLAWFANMHLWITGLAVLAVIGAWGWIAWQTRRTRCKPAASTLYVMVAATALMSTAVLWPFIEEQLVSLLTV
ncbi:tetratricopeptide repeat protein [Bradyrhizobium sp. 157]|uniref:tetratricopeptide repeat protein n=1 Tax=Bradyrhizobium sp. 157 TaxID=2782631 RepID=UPI001FFAC962|nr:tetratricopeptide repeat protein [Bradyrhizobium sp. 157]